VAVPSPAPARAMQEKLATMSVPFVPNAGQWDARAAFAASTLAGTLFVTNEGKLVYSLPATAAPGDTSNGRAWALTETFVSAAGHALHATPGGDRPGMAKVSYFTGGDAKRHRAGIGTYERVDLGQVFEGVNVQLRATGTNVEKIFTVAPRHDPRQIHVRLEGATRLEVGDHGELIAHTGNGPVTYTAPIAFQEAAGGARRDVAVRYALDAASQTYSFALGDYDRAHPLVIDPLLQSTYLGGSGVDIAWAVAIHPRTGDVYVAGQTGSTGFPQVTGGYSATKSGTRDGFVSRLSGDLKTLYQSTYLGGTGESAIRAIAIHPSTFEIYVAGWTTSSAFPGVPGFVDQSSAGGGRDGFVARLAPTLTALRIASYLGGAGDDEIRAMAIHPHTGDIDVTGVTGSPMDFPVTAGAAQTIFGGGTDAFVSRMSQDFSPSTFPRFTTLLGGTGNDSAYALAIHPRSGDIFVGGDTTSTDLPGISAASAQASKPNFTFAGFVTRVNKNLSGPLRSTYLTAGADDTVFTLAAHPVTGEVIAAGASLFSASGPDLPGLAGSPQPMNAGSYDAFVSRLTPALDAVLRSTYLGGTDPEQLYAIVVHPSGEVIVAGGTLSTAFATPASTKAIQPTFGGGSGDMFLARYTPDLSFRTQVTYLGVGGIDEAHALAVSPIEGDIVVAGLSTATGFPGTATGAPTTYSASTEGVASRLSSDLTAVNTIPAPVVFIPQSNVAPYFLRISNEIRMANVPVGAANYGSAFLSGQPGSEQCATTSPGCCTNNVPVGQCPGFYTGWTSSPYLLLEAGDYLAVRHGAAASGTAVTNLLIGGKAFPFVTSTGNASLRCNLDVNADDQLRPDVEGLILLRALFGLKGAAVVAGTGVGIADWEMMRATINAYCGTNFE
ncbi:MAG: hypothetical protein KAX84_16730, partial [Burkholderiales bacterium]|nr:hypothetical protein [Burkholderiales bacterium]